MKHFLINIPWVNRLTLLLGSPPGTVNPILFDGLMLMQSIQPPYSYGLSAFVAFRIIPLDKQPGVQPIGSGEVPQWIIAKAVLHLVDLDICKACGTLQACAGCEGGCEAAVHAVRQFFHDPGSQQFF